MKDRLLMLKEFIDKNGKVQNPIYKKENELLKSYFGKDYKKERDDISCFVVASSGLPTHQDHNFTRYFDNFKRVFEHHNKKIAIYNKNHPGYKIIFFIYDESTAYIEAIDKKYVKENPKKGEISCGKPHLACCDKRFLDVIINSEVDYVIWYAPWKLLQAAGLGIFPLPKCAIFDVKNLTDKKLVEYNHDMMISAEE